MTANINIRLTIEQVQHAGEYFVGVHDYQADDPLGTPYTDKPYFPRNWTPPNMRPPVPEVRRFKYSGDQLYLVEGVEWMLFYALWLRNPSWSEATAKDFYARHMRDDAGFTNKAAWNSDNPRKSWVLNLNPTKPPMELLGIVCPGGNVFRWSGSDAAFKKDQMCEAVWNLDYEWLTGNLTRGNARDFALSLPAWLIHTARIVHPEKIGDPIAGAPNGVFRVTNWDGNFGVPLIAKGGRKAVVDGFHVVENWLQQNRLKKTA